MRQVSVWRIARHAFRGSFSAANSLAAIVGSGILLLLSILFGWNVWIPEGVSGLFFGALFSTFAVWLLIFLARALYAPLHFELEPHGGLAALARRKLGSLMAPILLMYGSFLVFLCVFSGASIWLLLQIKDEASPLKVGAAAEHQPDFTLDRPASIYFLQWDIRKSVEIMLRKEVQLNSDSWDSIGFNLRNRTNYPVADVSVSWQTNLLNVKNLIDRYQIFKNVIVQFDDNRFSIDRKDKAIPGHAFDNAYHAEVNIAFVNQDTQLYLPLKLYGPCLVYFVANMPDKIGEKSPPLTFLVNVSWNIPGGGKDQQFKITATAINTKPGNVEAPLVSGRVDFDVERLK